MWLRLHGWMCVGIYILFFVIFTFAPVSCITLSFFILLSLSARFTSYLHGLSTEVKYVDDH